MSRYYKAKDVIMFLNMKCPKDMWEYQIADLPTIDIVRCGECKCCRNELIEEYMPLYIYCEKWNHETDFDGFCSAGERIEK